MKPVVCQQCKQPMRKGEKLKAHWRDLHPEEFMARQRWLGNSDAKLRAAILLAGEGMKAAGAQANLGPEQYSRLSESQLERQATKDTDEAER